MCICLSQVKSCEKKFCVELESGGLDKEKYEKYLNFLNEQIN